MARGQSSRMQLEMIHGTLLSRLVALYAFMLHSGIVALRMTALQIPQHVVLNETVRMQCNFNLDKETLYSVKWYKDGHEFYRYLPRDMPTVQTFRVPGVNVNTRNSTERSVVLKNVNLTSSGRYRCEVSAEAPAFQTVSDHADMTVVVLPDEGPRITGGRSRYQVGDVVYMNCTSAPSKPAALLTWYINGDPADTQYLQGPHITDVDEKGLETAVLGLEFRVAKKHFKRGDMKLKCLATIATVYLQSNEESVEGDERILKAPVMESRETRAQSHTRNDLTNGGQSATILNWMIIVPITWFVLAR
ncbi:cell adhesion molecule 2-like isoform X2 [Colletes latitarsis]|uniref:cell adhesion molecule 2-like isoform X2 n=1 Tax=Colletes latitarsis TaxID=2605962 RepID=UPI0040360C05